MAAEWLRADQIAAMTLRAAQVDEDLRPLSHSQLGKVLQQDVPALAAQDGRWRALVGGLMSAFRAAEGEGQMNSVVARWQGHAAATWLDALGPASGRALTALHEAQAALADTPPAPRGAAE